MRARDAGAMAYLVKPFTIGRPGPRHRARAGRHAEIVALEAEVEDLEERLTTRTLVDRPRRCSRREYGLPEPEAFRWIQKTSMDRGRPCARWPSPWSIRR